MAGGKEKARNFIVRYKGIFMFLAVLLIAQLVLALRLILINEVDLSVEHKGSQLPHPDRSHTVPVKSAPKASETKSVVDGASNEEAKVPSRSVVLEGLDLPASCDVSGKDAVSAIRRATTTHCKEYLANISCLIATGTLYPKRLPRFCKREDTTYMKHVGCFQDDKTNRLLGGLYTLLKDTNSPQNCVDACLQSGFPYAGVQYSVECFCGNVRPSAATINDSALCNMKCPLNVNNDVTCGGYFIIDVYETGVFRDNEVSAAAVDFKHASKELIAAASERGRARVVFFLTLNGRALRQVIRLIKSLFHERHYFYIHVDARQDYMFRELLALGYKLPGNVRFMRGRLSTIWGGASLLKILLSGMRDLVENGTEWGWTWDYVINLSESDFPLKTNEELETFLTLNKGKNFLKSHGRDVQNFILKQGLDKTFVECEHRMWRIGDRKLPAGIHMDGGSDWIALHLDFVKYVISTDDDLVNGLLKIFDHTLLPAESFFHIALRNSEMCSTFVDNNLHVTNWKRKLGCKCQYKNIVDWCGCSPNDFRLSDWGRLQETQGKLLFFGRKFEAAVNQGIINQLESYLYPNRGDINYPTQNTYWQSIFHQHDLTPRADDSHLTLGSSLARIAASDFYTQLLQFPELDLYSSIVTDTNFQTKFEELTAYFQHDRFAGIIVRFEAFAGEAQIFKAEAWYKLQNFATFQPWNAEIDKYHAKIQHLQVGCDYDQKEQIFRNFAGSVAPLSEPTLAYHVYADEAINLTFVWINPMNSVQAVQNFSIQIGITANFAKPALKMPLVPGNWSVKVLSEEGHLVAEVVFLVSVGEYYHGKPISLPQNNILNGHAHAFSGNEKDSGVNWTPTVLHPAIDVQTKKFYDMQATCLVEPEGSDLQNWALLNVIDDLGERELNAIGGKNLQRCSDTPWSTLYPDPKSTVDGIDPETGLLLP